MRFARWLLRQYKLDTPIGDLARDAKQDDTFPKKAGYIAVRNHLVVMGACREAMIALESAKAEYDRLFGGDSCK